MRKRATTPTSTDHKAKKKSGNAESVFTRPSKANAELVRRFFPRASRGFLELNEGGNIKPDGKHRSWGAGWREIGGQKIYARSRWEANYARYLEVLRLNNEIVQWEYEPETFWFMGIKRGVRSYLPDFKVTFKAGRIEFHEVKGWMDARSKTKIKRMAKYHPNIKLIVITEKWFSSNRLKLAGLIPDWEQGR